MNSTSHLARLDTRITRRRVLAYRTASTGSLFEAALCQGHKARAKSGPVAAGTTRFPAIDPVLSKPIWKAVEVRFTNGPDHATQEQVFAVLDEYVLDMGYGDQRDRGYAYVWYEWEIDNDDPTLTIFSPDENALMAIRLAL